MMKSTNLTPSGQRPGQGVLFTNQNIIIMVISLFNAERLNYGRDFEITINGKTHKGILYEDCRITEIYKKSLHAYGMRHPDDAWDEPATVSPNYPMVNFFGTFITKKELPITEETDIDDWNELN